MANKLELFNYAMEGARGRYGTDAYFKRALRRGWLALKHLPDGEGRKILDVGSGNGLFVPAYYRVWNYAEVDIIGMEHPESTRISITAGEKAHGVMAYACDVETQRWPQADASYDTVVCMEMLEHMVFDPAFVMNEMNRICKPGAKVLVTVPNAASDHCLCSLLNDGQPGFLRGYFTHPLESRAERDVETIRNLCHFHEYTATELRVLATATGFEIDFLTGVSPDPVYWDSPKMSLVRGLVHAMFPRTRRIRDDLILAVMTKKEYRPLNQLADRFPEPLYRKGRC